MTKKRDVLVRLTRDELLAAADRLGVDLPERRAKDPIVETLVGSRKAPVAEILADLKRDRLKELCRELGLDDSGKEKAEIVARLTGESKTLEENQLGLGFGADHSKAAEPASAARPSEPAPAEATAEAKPRRGRPAKAEKAASKGGELGGLETKLWQAADKLRNNMDAAEYKHVVLGLIFLKYISDAFEELHAKLIAGEHRAPELRFFNRRQQHQFLGAVFNRLENQYARNLSHRLDYEDARHHWKFRKVADKKRLVDGDVLDANNAFGFQFVDPIHQQKRVAMRQNFADR